MTWTPEKLAEAANLYRTMTAKQMAEHYGVSHCYIRRVLHDHGISDPKDVSRHRRDIICRLWTRGSIRELAEYLGVEPRTVRRHARRMGLVERTNQMAAFPVQPVKAQPQPRRRKSGHLLQIQAEQLQLFAAA